jgi:molecular chaperone DnaK
MVKDAESHADEDRRIKEKIEARNQLDSLIYQVEKDTTEWGDKFAGDSKTRVESALERSRKALKQDDLAELQGAREELMQAFSAAGQQFYQAQAAEQPQGGPTAGAETGDEPAGAGARTGAQDDVVEADYEIVDDKK